LFTRLPVYALNLDCVWFCLPVVYRWVATRGYPLRVYGLPVTTLCRIAVLRFTDFTQLPLICWFCVGRVYVPRSAFTFCVHFTRYVTTRVTFAFVRSDLRLRLDCVALRSVCLRSARCYAFTRLLRYRLVPAFAVVIPVLRYAPRLIHHTFYVATRTFVYLHCCHVVYVTLRSAICCRTLLHDLPTFPLRCSTFAFTFTVVVVVAGTLLRSFVVDCWCHLPIDFMIAIYRCLRCYVTLPRLRLLRCYVPFTLLRYVTTVCTVIAPFAITFGLGYCYAAVGSYTTVAFHGSSSSLVCGAARRSLRARVLRLRAPTPRLPLRFGCVPAPRFAVYLVYYTRYVVTDSRLFILVSFCSAVYARLRCTAVGWIPTRAPHLAVTTTRLRLRFVDFGWLPPCVHARLFSRFALPFYRLRLFAVTLPLRTYAFRITHRFTFTTFLPVPRWLRSAFTVAVTRRLHTHLRTTATTHVLRLVCYVYVYTPRGFVYRYACTPPRSTDAFTHIPPVGLRLVPLRILHAPVAAFGCLVGFTTGLHAFYTHAGYRLRLVTFTLRLRCRVSFYATFILRVVTWLIWTYVVVTFVWFAFYRLLVTFTTRFTGLLRCAVYTAPHAPPHITVPVDLRYTRCYVYVAVVYVPRCLRGWLHVATFVAGFTRCRARLLFVTFLDFALHVWLVVHRCCWIATPDFLCTFFGFSFPFRCVCCVPRVPFVPVTLRVPAFTFTFYHYTHCTFAFTGYFALRLRVYARWFTFHVYILHTYRLPTHIFPPRGYALVLAFRYLPFADYHLVTVALYGLRCCPHVTFAWFATFYVTHYVYVTVCGSTRFWFAFPARVRSFAVGLRWFAVTTTVHTLRFALRLRYARCGCYTAFILVSATATHLHGYRAVPVATHWFTRYVWLRFTTPVPLPTHPGLPIYGCSSRCCRLPYARFPGLRVAARLVGCILHRFLCPAWLRYLRTPVTRLGYVTGLLHFHVYRVVRFACGYGYVPGLRTHVHHGCCTFTPVAVVRGSVYRFYTVYRCPVCWLQFWTHTVVVTFCTPFYTHTLVGLRTYHGFYHTTHFTTFCRWFRDCPHTYTRLRFTFCDHGWICCRLRLLPFTFTLLRSGSPVTRLRAVLRFACSFTLRVCYVPCYVDLPLLRYVYTFTFGFSRVAARFVHVYYGCVPAFTHYLRCVYRYVHLRLPRLRCRVQFVTAFTFTHVTLVTLLIWLRCTRTPGYVYPVAFCVYVTRCYPFTPFAVTHVILPAFGCHVWITALRPFTAFYTVFCCHTHFRCSCCATFTLPFYAVRLDSHCYPVYFTTYVWLPVPVVDWWFRLRYCLILVVPVLRLFCPVRCYVTRIRTFCARGLPHGFTPVYPFTTPFRLFTSIAFRLLRYVDYRCLLLRYAFVDFRLHSRCCRLFTFGFAFAFGGLRYARNTPHHIRLRSPTVCYDLRCCCIWCLPFRYFALLPFVVRYVCWISVALRYATYVYVVELLLHYRDCLHRLRLIYLLLLRAVPFIYDLRCVHVLYVVAHYMFTLLYVRCWVFCCVTHVTHALLRSAVTFTLRLRLRCYTLFVVTLLLLFPLRYVVCCGGLHTHTTFTFYAPLYTRAFGHRVLRVGLFHHSLGYCVALYRYVVRLTTFYVGLPPVYFAVNTHSLPLHVTVYHVHVLPLPALPFRSCAFVACRYLRILPFVALRCVRSRFDSGSRTLPLRLRLVTRLRCGFTFTFLYHIHYVYVGCVTRCVVYVAYILRLQYILRLHALARLHTFTFVAILLLPFVCCCRLRCCTRLFVLFYVYFVTFVVLYVVTLFVIWVNLLLRCVITDCCYVGVCYPHTRTTVPLLLFTFTLFVRLHCVWFCVRCRTRFPFVTLRCYTVVHYVSVHDVHVWLRVAVACPFPHAPCRYVALLRLRCTLRYVRCYVVDWFYIALFPFTRCRSVRLLLRLLYRAYVFALRCVVHLRAFVTVPTRCVCHTRLRYVCPGLVYRFTCYPLWFTLWFAFGCRCRLRYRVYHAHTLFYTPYPPISHTATFCVWIWVTVGSHAAGLLRTRTHGLPHVTGFWFRVCVLVTMPVYAFPVLVSRFVTALVWITHAVVVRVCVSAYGFLRLDYVYVYVCPTYVWLYHAHCRGCVLLRFTHTLCFPVYRSHTLPVTGYLYVTLRLHWFADLLPVYAQFSLRLIAHFACVCHYARYMPRTVATPYVCPFALPRYYRFTFHSCRCVTTTFCVRTRLRLRLVVVYGLRFTFTGLRFVCISLQFGLRCSVPAPLPFARLPGFTFTPLPPPVCILFCCTFTLDSPCLVRLLVGLVPLPPPSLVADLLRYTHTFFVTLYAFAGYTTFCCRLLPAFVAFGSTVHTGALHWRSPPDYILHMPYVDFTTGAYTHTLRYALFITVCSTRYDRLRVLHVLYAYAYAFYVAFVVVVVVCCYRCCWTLFVVRSTFPPVTVVVITVTITDCRYTLLIYICYPFRTFRLRIAFRVTGLLLITAYTHVADWLFIPPHTYGCLLLPVCYPFGYAHAFTLFAFTLRCRLDFPHALRTLILLRYVRLRYVTLFVTVTVEFVYVYVCYILPHPRYTV